MSSSPVTDATSRTLAAALDLRFRRQQLLTSNIANADTPNYQPVDLSFEGALRGAIEDGDPMPPGFDATHAKHLDGAMPVDAEPAEVVVRPDITNSLDGNGVDLDREMARMTDNAVHFQTIAEAARRRLAIVNYVLTQLSTG